MQLTKLRFAALVEATKSKQETASPPPIHLGGSYFLEKIDVYDVPDSLHLIVTSRWVLPDTVYKITQLLNEHPVAFVWCVRGTNTHFVWLIRDDELEKDRFMSHGNLSPTVDKPNIEAALPWIRGKLRKVGEDI